MPYDIIADFYNLIDIGLFDAATVLLIMGFIIWEIPRTIKIMSEEYTEGLYPEGGRIVDIVLLVIGLAAVFFFMGNATHIIAFLKVPGIIAFFLIIMVVVPLIIILSYFKRFFGKIEANESITVFLVHAFLDLMHTLFYIGLALLVIPVAGFLIFG